MKKEDIPLRDESGWQWQKSSADWSVTPGEVDVSPTVSVMRPLGHCPENGLPATGASIPFQDEAD
jgi:hypothetical protein